MSGGAQGPFPPEDVPPPPAFDPVARAHGAEASSSGSQQDQQALLADKVSAARYANDSCSIQFLLQHSLLVCRKAHYESDCGAVHASHPAVSGLLL